MSKPPEPPKSTSPADADAGKPLTREQIEKLPVSGVSRRAICNASGGRMERIGQRSVDNAFILVMDDRRFVYVRNQAKNQGRRTAYDTGSLRKAIAPQAAGEGKQLDHVASTGVEGGRMGVKYSLVGLVKAEVNRSHGATNEKGPAPTREAAKAFGGAPEHVSYMTNEMAQKLSGAPSSGRGRSKLTKLLSRTEREAISNALLQKPEDQRRLEALGRSGDSARRVKALSTSRAKSR